MNPIDFAAEIIQFVVVGQYDVLVSSNEALCSLLALPFLAGLFQSNDKLDITGFVHVWRSYLIILRRMTVKMLCINNKKTLAMTEEQECRPGTKSVTASLHSELLLTRPWSKVVH